MKIKAENDITLINLLLATFGESSRTKVKKMIQYGFVSIDGKTLTRATTLVKAGTELEIRKYQGVPVNQTSPFPVLFEDEYYIAILKPAGILSVKTEQEEENHCFHQVNLWMKEKTKGNGRIHIVHRLDREVAGILLFAKSEDARAKIIDAWKEVVKRYYALVEGRPPRKEGTVESWLHEDSGLRVFSGPNTADAKHAVTHYKAERKLGPYTLLKVELETGRKNQIRVHMSDLGCPIVGDAKYGADRRFHRQIRLFACSLSFRHPYTSEVVEIQAKLPAGFLKPSNKDEHY